jgi:hypothetical protein
MKPTEKNQAPALKPTQATKRNDRAYPADQEALDKQQQRIRRAAAAGAAPLESLSRPPAPPAPAQPADPAKPVSEVKGLSASTPVAARPLPQPVRQFQAASAAPPATAAPRQEPAKKPEQSKTPVSGPPKAKIRFILVEPKARHVLLSGEFTGWAAKAVPMKRGSDGHWETTISLAPGRYEYKFIVDGQWIPDPMAQEVVWNTHGTLNSVIVVRD